MFTTEIGRSELLVRCFFCNSSQGFYLDIGCSDYKRNSTTYYLEKHQNWLGIGVDPLETLREGWLTFRLRSKFFAYAATDKPGESIQFYSAGGISAMEIDTKNLKTWEARKKFKAVEIQVPTITMNDLLDRQGELKINFLSIGGHRCSSIANVLVMVVVAQSLRA